MTAPENTITLAVETRIDQLCDQFEETWSSTASPCIEELVEEFVAAPDRSVLFRRLLEVDLELSARSDFHPSEADYRRRFPEFAETIADVCRHSRASHAPSAAALSEAATISICQADTSSVPSDVTPRPPMPARIGRFEVIEMLGRGGFGTVYLARDPKVGRDIAIKVPNSHRPTSLVDASRFLREARAAATLRHANICAVHDIGEEDGHAFIVMEYIAGEPLSTLIQRGDRLPIDRIVQLVRELALALEVVHQQGIIHRDLKPSNVIIDTSGTPIIMDFGLARLSQTDDESITHGGDILGTPTYMPPEQARGEVQAIDARSDVYSLGAILYELLCGQRPYRGSAPEIIGRIQHATPPRPSAHDPQVDRRLEAICLKAMARSANQRYQSMAEFAAALSEFSVTSKNDRRVVYRRAGWITAALSLIAFAAAITYVQTDKGWLRIQTEEDVQLVVTRDGREVTIIDTKTLSRVRLHSGEYEIKLQDDRNDVRLSRSRFTMARGEREIVSIHRSPLLPAHRDSDAAESASKSSTKGTRAPVFLQGKWRVQNGELVTEPTDAEPRQMLIFGDPTWTDYDIQVDVWCERQVLTYSVVCRYNAEKEYWLFSFGGWGPKNADLVCILSDEDGYRHPSRRWLPNTLHGQSGVWQKVGIKARGESICVSFDGKELATSSHPRLTNGLIGCYTFSSGKVRWRNLYVRAPDGTLLWEGFPDLSPQQVPSVESDQPISTDCGIPTTTTINNGEATDPTSLRKE